MMDCTDRHERYFLRLLSKNVMLYTEMVATKSAIYGDKKKILGFNEIEKPLGLQVGGSDKDELSILFCLFEIADASKPSDFLDFADASKPS